MRAVAKKTPSTRRRKAGASKSSARGGAKPRRKAQGSAARRKRTGGGGGGRLAGAAAGLRRLASAVSAYAVVLIGAGLFLFILFLWAGGYLANAGRSFNAGLARLTAGAGFAVERVSVRGLHNASADDVRRIVNPHLGRSLVHVDLEDVRAEVEALGWVKHAAVARLLPDTLHVSVIERDPIAIWQNDGALRLIDADGAVVAPVRLDQRSDLLLVVGEGADVEAAAFLDSVAPYAEVRKRLVAAVRSGQRRWTLRMRGGASVKLPESGQDEALRVLAQLHDEHGILDQPLEYIDLRDAARAVLRPASGPAAVLSAQNRGEDV